MEYIIWNCRINCDRTIIIHDYCEQLSLLIFKTPRNTHSNKPVPRYHLDCEYEEN